ncbi:unnamed protein product [Ectocarpus sp. CCAP 1310/34]|nr:unnamed protein product [Ectocarpus sp. CCAP 1310/34]
MGRFYNIFQRDTSGVVGPLQFRRICRGDVVQQIIDGERNGHGGALVSRTGRWKPLCGGSLALGFVIQNFHIVAQEFHIAAGHGVLFVVADVSRSDAVGGSLLLEIDEGSVVDTFVHDHVEMGKLLVTAERRSAKV